MRRFHFIPLSFRLFLSKIKRKRLLIRRLDRISQSRSNDPIVYLLNIPSHGNMGDQLIAYAEFILLNKEYDEKRIITFSTGQLECGIKLLQKVIRPNDLVFVTGGGFLGSIYPPEEKRFQDIMRYFSSNRIFLFPQTFHYEENSVLLSKTIELHKKCKSLIIATRESSSYEFIKSHFFNAKVLLLPDVTTTLDFSNEEVYRDGICICSRQDKEKTDDSGCLFNAFVRLANDRNIKIRFIDTQVPYSIQKSKREEEVHKKVREFSSSQLVITDRLHGMLYSIITGTPVIAIDNSTKKISGAYNDWFKGIKYVKFCSSEQETEKMLNDMLPLGGQNYNPEFFNSKIKELFNYA